MNLNLTDPEIQNLMLFLQTCQISGKEAMALAILQQKIQQQIQENQQIIKKVAEKLEPNGKSEPIANKEKK